MTTCNPPDPRAIAEALELTADHGLDLETWGDFLLANNPAEYAPPPPPDRGETAMTQQTRVALYETRVREGRSLFHPDDVTDGTDLRVGVVSERPDGKCGRLRNGADPIHQTLAREDGL
jgi:hypothetical protein